MSKFWRKIRNHHLPHHSANNNTAISLKFCGTACLIRNGVIILAPLPHMIHVQYVQCTVYLVHVHISLFFGSPHNTFCSRLCTHVYICVVFMHYTTHTHFRVAVDCAQSGCDLRDAVGELSSIRLGDSHRSEPWWELAKPKRFLEQILILWSLLRMMVTNNNNNNKIFRSEVKDPTFWTFCPNNNNVSWPTFLILTFTHLPWTFARMSFNRLELIKLN